MAELINLAGTTSHSFTIGQDGVTIYYGNTEPRDEIGKVGDTYIQNVTEIEDSHGEGTGEFKDFGRVFTKMVVDNVVKWVPNKNYSFDTPIIKAEETDLESNNFKIKLQQAEAPIAAASSNKTTDYTNNRNSFGVTRYATDAEAKVSDAKKTALYASYKNEDAGSHLPTVYNTETDSVTGNDTYMPDKFIAVTPAQMADNIKVEMKRAIMVEGTLSTLFQSTRVSDYESIKTDNLASAINYEYARAYTEENNLQSQIDAITSKSDVVDIVNNYSDLIAYNVAPLNDNDVLKVLEDETDNKATTYYRLSLVPTNPDTYPTKASLPAVTQADKDKVVKVTSDETHSNQVAYYECRKVMGTWQWEYATPSKTTGGSTTIDTTHFWDYIGQEGSYYTKAESNYRFVNTIDNVNEEVTGIKSFTDVIKRDETFGTSEQAIIQSNDINPSVQDYTSKGSIETDVLYASSKISNRTKVTNATASKNGYLDLQVSDTGVGTLTLGGTVSSWSNNTASDSKTSNDIATIGWVNDYNKSTKVVHREGNEEIGGTKTFTSNVVVPQTPTENTHATSKKYVDDNLSLKVNTSDLPAISSGTTGQVIACPASGSKYVWKTIKDISTLRDLDDTSFDNIIQEGQTIIYDPNEGEGGAWKNGYQTTATIVYW